MNLFVDPLSLPPNKYIVATYQMTSLTNLRQAAWALAIGQSVGNPTERNQWETDELFANHSCLILHDELELQKKQSGRVSIAFPVANIGWDDGDGVSQLLCMLMGGQVDIDIIIQCRLVELVLPKDIIEYDLGHGVQSYGLSGLRKLTGQYGKPLLGAIVKPKTGMSPEVLLELVKQLVENQIDWLKEDEILGSPEVCPFNKRVPLITNWLRTHAPHVVYCFCINADTPTAVQRAKFVQFHGGNGVHLNFWSGFGAYSTIVRETNLFVHFQKSGDKVITDPRNPYGIDWNVLCYLAGAMGVDSIHAGMLGGYLSTDENELRKVFKTLGSFNVTPALSCGLHPGLVDSIRATVGNDFMANVGGAIHGHPGGTAAGAKAMRQAIDGTGGPEFDAAIAKWGKV